MATFQVCGDNLEMITIKSDTLRGAKQFARKNGFMEIFEVVNGEEVAVHTDVSGCGDWIQTK